jgi:hypothetical protein
MNINYFWKLFLQSQVYFLLIKCQAELGGVSSKEAQGKINTNTKTK